MKKKSLILFLLLIFISGTSFQPLHSLITNVNPSIFVISSPSMKPVLNIGDLVFVTKMNPIEIIASEEKGDIIVIKGPQYFLEQGYPKELLNIANNTPIIHRVIEKSYDAQKNEWFFITKGDANDFIDGGWNFLNSSDNGNYLLVEYNSSRVIEIPQSEIIGKVYFILPFFGYMALFSDQIIWVLVALIIFFVILDGLKIQIFLKVRRMKTSEI